MFRVSQLAPYFTVVRKAFTGSTGPIQVATPNPDRSAIYFSNNQGGNLYLDITTNGSVTQAMRSLVGGGTIALYWQLDGILTTEPWYWYPTGAGGNLVVTELIWQPTGAQS